MKYKIPYGNGYQALMIPDTVSAELLQADAAGDTSGTGENATVLAAMAKPIGSPTLWELARGKATAVIICSDHTRPVPSQKIIPHMLAELREANPQIKITLLIATGFHRATTYAELVAKFGSAIVEQEDIVVHDCTDTGSLCQIGILPSGAPLVINRIAAETELLLSEGFIEPHFFAGFSGGRKSVLPGVCGRETVLGNHCSAFIDSPYARTGVLEGNPINTDMMAASAMAKLAYIVNVILDENKQVAAAVAGDPDTAHTAGCKKLLALCRVQPSALGDIIITSNGGAPLDQNIYQSVKGLTAAEAAAAPDAILIICAACNDGAGGDAFYRALRDCKSPTGLLQDIRQVPMEKTAPDQWETQIMARILAAFRVVLVCEPAMRATAHEMKLQTAASLQEAYDYARSVKGEDAHVIIIPDGVSVMVGKAVN